MSSKSHTSRQDRKAKIRNAANLIPNLPEGSEKEDETRAMKDEHLSVPAKKRKREKADNSVEKDDEAHRKKVKSERKRAKKVEKEGHRKNDTANLATEVTDKGMPVKQPVDMDAKLTAEKQLGANQKAIKKEKKTNQESTLNEIQVSDIDMTSSVKAGPEENKLISIDNSLPPKKTKKERKAERKAERNAERKAAAATTATVDAGIQDDLSKATTIQEEKIDLLSESPGTSPDSSSRSGRFIVFVGNLPFTATTASIAAHFAKLKPCAIRNLTRKEDPGQSRGIAFVEFENFDTHKTALKTMHHSIFNDGKSEPRKINVELTAGGGGNKDTRKAKIKTKNSRLNEQRVRRAQEDEKAKLLKSAVDNTAVGNDAIHPSRRKMISV